MFNISFIICKIIFNLYNSMKLMMDECFIMKLKMFFALAINKIQF